MADGLLPTEIVWITVRSAVAMTDTVPLPRLAT